MTKQVTDTIMLVRPTAFHLNEETAVDNHFQHELQFSAGEIQQRARLEFDTFSQELTSNGIEVIEFVSEEGSDTPDSIFPNNWISTHEAGIIYIYAIHAENRRLEKRRDIVESLRSRFGYHTVYDFSGLEAANGFVEGTGSMIFDRQNKIAYAAYSERTTEQGLRAFAEQTGYHYLGFDANQTVNGQRLPIYHTNVMMEVGEHFAVVCLGSIDDKKQRHDVLDRLEVTGKEIIEISEAQVRSFAGNILQVCNVEGKRFIVMSTAAYEIFSFEQKRRLSQHGTLLHSPIPTIETLGGGGVRCMMAEIFKPEKQEVEIDD
ncbi:MAG: arginine deiminase-related protein [Bacteroidota bacterium]